MKLRPYVRYTGQRYVEARRAYSHNTDVLKDNAKLRSISFGENAIVCRYDEESSFYIRVGKILLLVISFAGCVGGGFLLGILLSSLSLAFALVFPVAGLIGFFYILSKLMPFLTAYTIIYDIVNEGGKVTLIRQDTEKLIFVKYYNPKLLESKADRLIIGCENKYGAEVILMVPKKYPRLEDYFENKESAPAEQVAPPVRSLNDELEAARDKLVYSSPEAFEEKLREFFAEDGELSLSHDSAAGEEWAYLNKKDETYMLSTRIGIVFARINCEKPEVSRALESMHVVYVDSYVRNEWELDVERLRENVPEIAWCASEGSVNTESMSLQELYWATV